MRLFNRKDFMALPAGVLFCKGKPWHFEDISVKEDTLTRDEEPIDWFYQQLCWIECFDCGDASAKFTDMLENGASYPMEDAVSRDGCFDDEDIFLVFEVADLERLKAMVDRAISLRHLSK